MLLVQLAPSLTELDNNLLLRQVLTNDGTVFLRIADERGWTPAQNAEDKSSLFDEVLGERVSDE